MGFNIMLLLSIWKYLLFLTLFWASKKKKPTHITEKDLVCSWLPKNESKV